MQESFTCIIHTKLALIQIQKFKTFMHVLQMKTNDQ